MKKRPALPAVIAVPTLKNILWFHCSIRSGCPDRLRSWSGLVETDFQGRLRFSYANRPVKVYMELGSYFLFLKEQIKDIIIIKFRDRDVQL